MDFEDRYKRKVIEENMTCLEKYALYLNGKLRLNGDRNGYAFYTNPSWKWKDLAAIRENLVENPQIYCDQVPNLGMSPIIDINFRDIKGKSSLSVGKPRKVNV